jgi:hypothetical protein
MAITVSTRKPTGLLLRIRNAIKQGQIKTWNIDETGDLTQTPPQWRHEAWLRPKIVNGDLVFTTVPQAKKAISQKIYAVYHGRFIEMLQGHFDSDFSKVWASAQPEKGDLIQ